jgi:superfamily II DNA or RNA helicase/HKD family nuclease
MRLEEKGARVTRELAPGLYEQVITEDLDRLLRSIDRSTFEIEKGKLDPAEAHLVLARHGYELLRRALASVPGDGRERLDAQVSLLNQMVKALHQSVESADVGTEVVLDAAEELHALVPRQGLRTGAPARIERPGVPLTASALLINARDEHQIGHELRKELASADQVDLLCAFIKWSGLRLLERQLRMLHERGTRLRVLTTVYMGATERAALDALVGWGADVRISYDTRRTRLHAKAWLFHRRTGFSTAYIGSSNVSVAALVDGLEWNVRLSRTDVPDVLGKFQAAFDGYWEDGEFEPYDPERDAERFERARGDERSEGAFELVALDVRPYPYQQEILDKLAAERELHARWKNLVVAATGTGKTVIAALDYRRILATWGDARLLFVAHRREILNQSRSTFRAVLRDGSFGERWADGDRPAEGRHVFASIQTLARADLSGLRPDAFDVVIVDEVHHAEAPTYDRLLSHLRPRLLLGLTATPERADGQDIRRWFDGRIAAELRLWAALERGLLCPFQYFGLHDDVDLSDVKWKRGGYDVSGLEGVYVFSREIAIRRVAMVAQALRNKVVEPNQMRALGFCVSVKHAEFMAEQFTAMGIPSLAVSADTATQDRDGALRKLRDRSVNAIFAVDLFNEGVDVPAVDTILFLRPTESATVFLQQLGRGLRLADGKACLTVLDFVSRPSRQFRFDLRFRALLGGSRLHVERQIRDDFPVLPPGCAIQLDREAHRIVLESVRQVLRDGLTNLVEESRSLGESLGRTPTLTEFLAHAELELSELYRKRGKSWITWSGIRRVAGLLLGDAEAPDEEKLSAGLARVIHIDDPIRLDAYAKLLSCALPPRESEMDERTRRLVTMLHFSLWGRNAPDDDLDGALARLWANPTLRDELQELLSVLREGEDHLTPELHPDLSTPLRLHASYTLDEVLAAFAFSTVGRRYPLQAGVLFDKQTGCDLLFVTTEKSEREYSPRTMYRDYALSRDVFHWESQHTTGEDSVTGERYRQHLQQGTHVLLFVRRRRQDDRNITVPYTCLGFADYVSHDGERPMAITWRLRVPMPATLFAETRVAA